MAKGKYKRKRMRMERRETLICNVGISTRVVHLLQDAGIMTLSDLDACTIDKLTAIPGIGEAAIKEISKYRIETVV